MEKNRELIKGNLTEEDILKKYNYKQELNRNLKFFSSFAVAFSFISLTTGIFTNFQFALSTAGPAFILSWPITAVGQFLVCLIFAELSGAIPVSGYSYQWIKRLSTPFMSWITGWICFLYLVLLPTAIDVGLAPIIESLLGIKVTNGQTTAIVIGILVIQALLNIVGVKLCSIINNAAVFTESFGIIILTIVLFIAAMKNGVHASMIINTGSAPKGTSYIKSFIMSMLMGSFTLVGFESAANLSEETINAHKTVPKAIITSMLLAGVFGMLFLISAVFSIGNLNKVLASNNALPYVIQSNLGTVIGKLFLVMISVSIFACGLVVMTSGSRLIYAMSRDNAFFASEVFKKISPKTDSPVLATVLILILSIITALFSNSLTTLVGVTSVLPALIYLITIVCYALVRKKIKVKDKCFNLGKAAKPVFIGSIVWLIFELGILTLPHDYHMIALLTIILVILGIVLYKLYFENKILNENKEDKVEMIG
ncbi:APC family permease [Clostridium neuense]|uniref:APC family permease n=1 Tax=Clostridium neuense TaxID=1728934 RepID=A0ABW8TH33_9CLOT